MANQDKNRPADRPIAKTEPEARLARDPSDKPVFPAAATDLDGPPDTAVPGPREWLGDGRTAGEREHAARLSREAADDPVGAQGRSLLACFDPQAIAKALKVHVGDAERLVDVLLVRLGRGDAEERGVRFFKALARVSRGDSVDDVLRDAGREAGVDKPRIEDRT